MEQSFNKTRLFLGSCLALLVTALTFAMRAKIEEIFGPVEQGGVFGLSKEVIGWAFSPAFWGFTIAMVVGGFIIDIVKTRTLVWLAFFLQLVGAIIFIMAHNRETLFLANVFIGLGNGTVEASYNPLIATIYPKDKTKMLNRFHVWFPGGIVIGSLLAYLMMDTMGLKWQIYIGMLFIPIAVYGLILLGQSIIVAITLMTMLATDIIAFREGWMYLAFIGVVAIVSITEAWLIWKESIIFPVMFTLMLFTAATELVTNQWVNALLANVGVSPMLILALISGIMAVGRFFAGHLVHRIHPVGVLLMSSIFSAIGIYTLSLVSSPPLAIVGAIFFAVGICYFWPTMLGFTSEYIPKTGAMGLSLLGGSGFVSVAMFLPLMGRILEEKGTQVALQSIGILPVVLVIGFIILFIVYRNKKPVEL
jgi:MFS family permease